MYPVIALLRYVFSYVFKCKSECKHYLLSLKRQPLLKLCGVKFHKYKSFFENGGIHVVRIS